MNLDFFAAELDQRALFEFLFSSTDVRVFESYSRYGEDLREFRSLDELAATFTLGHDVAGNQGVATLQLWSPSVMRDLTISRIPLNPDVCHGHTFWHRIDGGGLMQLYLGGVNGHVITISHFGHWSQIGADKWDKDLGVNWEALKTLSNQIQYALRKRLASGKVPGCPVLTQAYELALAGYELKLAVQTPQAYPMPTPISRPRALRTPHS